MFCVQGGVGSVQGECSTSQQSSASSSGHGSSGSQQVLLQVQQDSNTEISTAMNADVFPEAPYAGGCRVIINEVCTISTERDISFVEFRRVCPVGSKMAKAMSLNGFVVLVLLGGIEIRQVMFASLQNQVYSVTEEINDRTRKKNRAFYFVIGTESARPSMAFSRTQVVDSWKTGLPEANHATYCIVLLYLDSKYRSSADSGREFYLDKVGDSYVATPLTVEKQQYIRDFVQDVTILGPPCPESDCGFFFDLLRVKEGVVGEEGLRIPLPDVPRKPDGSKEYKSLSRCSKDWYPMQLSSFELQEPSPGSKNNCPKPRVELPYSFQGKALQSTAQQLIVNAKIYMDNLHLNPGLLEGSPSEKTAQVLGISPTTVEQTMNNHKSNCIKTPGKKRSRSTPVIDQFDDFRKDQLVRIIQNFYQQNIGPTLDMVYDKFMEDVRIEEENRRNLGEEVVPFECSRWTLRKYLRQIGFRYKMINKRAVIMQRHDLMQKRYEYLSVMIKNRDSNDKRYVVYTGTESRS